jgi:hypothetical protein
MQRKSNTARAAQRQLPPIPKELVEQFVSGPMTAEAVEDISLAFKRALIERALGAELAHHLGYANGEPRTEQGTNLRNGSTPKTVLSRPCEIHPGASRIEPSGPKRVAEAPIAERARSKTRRTV